MRRPLVELFVITGSITFLLTSGVATAGSTASDESSIALPTAVTLIDAHTLAVALTIVCSDPQGNGTLSDRVPPFLDLTAIQSNGTISGHGVPVTALSGVVCDGRARNPAIVRVASDAGSPPFHVGVAAIKSDLQLAFDDPKPTGCSMDGCTIISETSSSVGPVSVPVIESVPPPTTTAAVSPLPNQSGWNRASAHVTFTARDGPAESGVLFISLSGGGPPGIVASNVAQEDISTARASMPPVTPLSASPLETQAVD